MKMKKMKKKLLLMTIGGISILQSAVASPEQERVYLLQLIHQIDAMQPTLQAAEHAQSSTARVQFHYTAYRDAQGRKHPGVWEDLQKIRTGIEEKLENVAVEPRTPEPVSGDYYNSEAPLEHPQ